MENFINPGIAAALQNIEEVSTYWKQQYDDL